MHMELDFTSKKSYLLHRRIDITSVLFALFLYNLSINHHNEN